LLVGKENWGTGWSLLGAFQWSRMQPFSRNLPYLNIYESVVKLA
jgi:hypothetical protein